MSIIALDAAPSDRLANLRALLAEKFPSEPVRSGLRWPTGLVSFDEVQGGLRRGVITETSGSLGSGALWLEVLLRGAAKSRWPAALLDVGGNFDPGGVEDVRLDRLLWVSCAEAGQAVKATDLLLRDGNLPLLVLDLQTRTPRELARVPASTWHRFQRLVETTSKVFVVMTCQPVIEAARVRIALRAHWSLTALRQRRTALLERLQPRGFERGQSSAGFAPHAATA
jgi:hypothetical protein